MHISEMTRRYRIIPARAGFTFVRAKQYSEMRIIPARAGFTLPMRVADLASADHPRSRGVYSDYVRGTDIEGGSSPLARGLRVRER